MNEPTHASAPPSSPLPLRLRQVADVLDRAFLGKSEPIRLMLIAAVAGEHLVLIGPPGTAKSAMIRLFAKLIRANYFEYLLTRFTEPNEIFGPINIQAFREGSYERRMEGMLPAAEIAFLDEIFKANSAILNSLLTVLNEKLYAVGAQRFRVPLLSAFGASNEVPEDEELMAVFDRFLLRVHSDNLDSYHFSALLERGIAHETAKLDGSLEATKPLVGSHELHALHKGFGARLRFSDDFLAEYKNLVFQIRNEGVSLSDRRAVKLLKLFAASAYLDGRGAPDASDFFVLKHIWNNLEQAEILANVVNPVLDAWHQAHPEAARVGATHVGLSSLVEELNRIRALLASNTAMTDMQLFAQLKALSELKAAFLRIGTAPATEGAARVDQLLGQVFEGSRFSA